MRKVDPINVAVVQNNLISIAEEMKRTMIRCAFDPVIYEVLDFGCAILDAHTNTLAQGVGFPLFIGALGPATKQCVEYIGEDNLEPGDVFVSAAGHISGAHPPDAILGSPIFYGGKLFGYAATKAHWLDIGAMVPYPTNSTDVFQEGLRLPPVKLYKGYELQSDIRDIIQWNSRMPYGLWGDIQSQIAACRAAEKRTGELLDKFGMDYTLACIDEMYAHGERVARAAIQQMPNGSWSIEDYLDDNGVDLETPVKIKVTLTVADDEMIFDYTGSADEQRSPMNCPFISTKSVSRLTMKALTTPHLPAHEGCFRPLKVIAPAGSLFNPGPMAPTMLYCWPAMQSIDITTRLVSQFMPEKVAAFSAADLCALFIYGPHCERTGRPWMIAAPHPIGMGADMHSDGESCLLHHSESGTRNVPIEVEESRDPILIERYELRQDSGGAGLYRGGLGLQRDFRLLAPGAAITLLERGKFPHWGCKSGKAGARNYVLISSSRQGEFEVLKSPEIGLDKGDVVSNRTGGGGGWGDPLERAPEKVLEDVVSGYVSPSSATEDYGVVIGETHGAYEVDTVKTAVLRDVKGIAARSDDSS
jgi:N-methylhydantoinase B